MAELSKIRKNGVDYDIKDAVARKAIEEFEPGGGLTTAQINALDNLFKVCSFTKADVSAEYNAFCTAFGIDGGNVHKHSYTSVVTTAATCTTAGVRTYTCNCGHSYTANIPATGHNYVDGVCTVCGATDPTYNPEATLTGISATYSGGNVPAGTAVTALTGVVVTAHYSDGSQRTVTGYTMSGTISEGSNTVTVSYGGKTATFTVTGIAAEEPDEPEDMGTVLLGNIDTADPTKYTMEFVKDEIPAILTYGFDSTTRKTALGGKRIVGVKIKVHTPGTLTVGKIDMTNYKKGDAPVLLDPHTVEVVSGINTIAVNYMLTETETIGICDANDTASISFNWTTSDQMKATTGTAYASQKLLDLGLYGAVLGGDN